MLESQDKSAFHVGLFVDGFTLRKVNEFYRLQNLSCAGIDFAGLRKWALAQASRHFWPDRAVELSAHYYHPYRDPRGTDRFCRTRIDFFSGELSKAGYEMHFAEVDYAKDLCPNLELEADALLYARYKKLDALVLASTQGQFAGLPARLAEMNIPTLLLGWNFVYRNQDREIHWHTDLDLKRAATYYIPMESIMNKASTDVLARGLFLSPRPTACRAASSGFRIRMSRSA